MVAVVACPVPVLQFFDNTGNPAAGGSLLTQVGGVNYITYSDSGGVTALPNPIPLNSRGEVSTAAGVSSQLFLVANIVYTFTLYDAYGNQVWVQKYVNGIQITTVDSLNIKYDQSLSELTAGIIPIDLSKPWGAFTRYGMDPTGVLDSSTAFVNACQGNAHVYDDCPGGGTYLFNSSALINRYPLRISGEGINYGGIGGTTLLLASSAGLDAATIRYSAFAAGVILEDINFAFRNAQLGQVGFQADMDLRQSTIQRCFASTSDASAANTTIFIYLAGGGIFTGGVSIRDCGTSVVQYGIYLNGSCTTVKIRDCELYGNSAAPNQAGIFANNQVTGASATGCTLDGWSGTNGRGILVNGPYWVQVSNHFENNTVNFEWIRGAGNARIWGQSYGDMLISGGVPIYPINNTDLCTVIGGPGNANLDLTTVNAEAGFQEHLRTILLGDFIVPAFSAGNFTASASMTWTVISGEVSNYSGSVYGHTMTVNWAILNSTAGGTASTALRIAIPGGFTAKRLVQTSCIIQNNNAYSFGLAQVQANATFIEIFIAAAGTGAWTLSANTGTNGSITFEVN